MISPSQNFRAKLSILLRGKEVFMPVVKIIELLGISNQSFEDAVENAVSEAAITIRNITGVDVKSFKADVKDGKIVQYKANVKIAFLIERK